MEQTTFLFSASVPNFHCYYKDKPFFYLAAREIFEGNLYILGLNVEMQLIVHEYGVRACLFIHCSIELFQHVSCQLNIEMEKI